MGRRKNNRNQARLSKLRHQKYMRMYMAVRFTQQQDWRKKLQLLGNIKPPAVTWPKTKTVSWETLPSLVLQLDKYGLLSPHLKSKKVHAWDQLFYNGKVKATWKRVRISVEHSCEDFWKVWKKKITPKTVIITNPPFQQDWLEPFFKFLTVLDRPFLLILQNTAPNRLYFGKCLYDRIQRRNELNIFALQKSFQMEQKGGRLAGFAGLTICTYYPKRWNFELDETKFERIIPIKSLHSIQ